MPSDIDLICECGEKFTIEFKNKAWIFIELKYRNSEFTTGQSLTYQRLAQDLSKLKPTVSVVAEHSVDNPAAVQKAIATAQDNGEIVTRSTVLTEIKQSKRAEKENDF